MNIERGMKRLSYLLFGLALIGVIFSADGNPALMGQYFVNWLIFVACYMTLFRLVGWVVKGFKKE